MAWLEEPGSGLRVYHYVDGQHAVTSIPATVELLVEGWRVTLKLDWSDDAMGGAMVVGSAFERVDGREVTFEALIALRIGELFHEATLRLVELEDGTIGTDLPRAEQRRLTNRKA